MCGRYSLTTPLEGLRDLFQFSERPNLAPRYNIAPTQQVAAVRLGGEPAERHFVWFKWGLIPSWAKDPAIGSRMINARAETLAEKPAFRSAFKRRRCLIAADGFYEWQARGKGPKQPYHIGLKGDGPFAFAGLWEAWRSQESEERVESCTIVTTDANTLLKPIHHRMPVIVAPEDYDLWLDADAPAEEALALLRPYPDDAMAFHPISTRVNKVANDDPAVIEPIALDSDRSNEASQGQLL